MKYILLFFIIISIILSCKSNSTDKKENKTQDRKNNSLWTMNPQAKNIPYSTMTGYIASNEFVCNYSSCHEMIEGGMEIEFCDIAPEKICSIKSKANKRFIIRTKEILTTKTYIVSSSNDSENWSISYKLNTKDNNDKGYANEDWILILNIEDIQYEELKIYGTAYLAINDIYHTAIAGKFGGDFCISGINNLKYEQKIDNIKWGDKLSLNKNQLPKVEFTGYILGQPFSFSKADVKDYSGRGFEFEISEFSEHTLCSIDDRGKAIIISSRKPLEPNIYYINSSQASNEWEVYYRYELPYNAETVNKKFPWEMLLSIDSVDQAKKLVKARVIIFFDDPTKSITGGTFESTICSN